MALARGIRAPAGADDANSQQSLFQSSLTFTSRANILGMGQVVAADTPAAAP